MKMDMMLSSATVQLDTEINNKHKTLIAAILQNFCLDANYYYLFSKSIESTKKIVSSQCTPSTLLT